MPRAEIDDDARRTARGRLKMLLVLLVCALPVIASYVAYFVVRPDGRTNYAALIDPPRPLPAALVLTDLEGRVAPHDGLRGNWTLLVVAGGACDARCERHLWIARQLREALGREKDRVDKLWIIDDAARPKTELLASLAAGVPTRVLRAPRDALAAWIEPAAASTLDAHLYIVDPRGHWMMRAPADVDPSKLKRDLDRLLRASASWHTPAKR